MSNLTLGKGFVYFDRFVNGTKTKTGERKISSTQEFNLAVSSDKLDHFDSDEGLKVKDDSVILQINRSGSFTTDDIDIENLAMYLTGDTSIQTQASATAQTSNFASVTKDREYQLGSSSGNPSGVRSVSNVVVKDDTVPTPVTFTVGTDYTVDAVLGRIKVLSTGTIANGKNLVVTYDVAAKSRNRIITAASATVDGALRFIATNPKGELRDYYMPYVTLSPNGDLALKGEEWQKIPFNIEINKLTGYEAIYADGRPF